METLKTKIKEKTLKANELKESLRHSKRIMEMSLRGDMKDNKKDENIDEINEISEESDVFDNDLNEEIEEKQFMNP